MNEDEKISTGTAVFRQCPYLFPKGAECHELGRLQALLYWKLINPASGQTKAVQRWRKCRGYWEEIYHEIDHYRDLLIVI